MNTTEILLALSKERLDYYADREPWAKILKDYIAALESEVLQLSIELDTAYIQLHR